MNYQRLVQVIFLAAIIACADCCAFAQQSASALSPARSSTQENLYAPGILFGDAKASLIVGYYWSASSQASVDNFKRYVAPLIRRLLKQTSPSYAVMLYQVLEDDKRDALGPGGLLLCPESARQYEWLVVKYLTQGRNVQQRQRQEIGIGKIHYSNATIRALAEQYRIDFRDCLMRASYHERWAKAVGLSIANDQKFGQKTYPYFVFDDSVVLPGDSRLKKLDDLARQP